MTKLELLKMPKKSYMNEEQLAFFSNYLKSQMSEILETIENVKNMLATNGHSVDMNDVATEQEIQQINLRTAEREARLLKKIKESLTLIKDGDYGYCEDTGEEIGLERLLARPTANLCVIAKEIREHKEKVTGLR